MRLQTYLLALATCALVGCANSDGLDNGDWQLDHQQSDGALLSVWGTSATDVWAVGGQAQKGLILHNDGSGWMSVPSPADQLLWWVYGFSADDVYAVGEGGLILHYDGSQWQRLSSGTEMTLYGVWGSSGDDVWIVGGQGNGPDGSAVVLRGNSGSFAVVDDIPRDLLPGALFKIYGSPQGAVAVGSKGAVLRYENDQWRREATPTTKTIFSLWGRADDDVYAVGGTGTGEILHFNGQEWHDIGRGAGERSLSGVFTAKGQPMIAVGPDAYILELYPDGTRVEPSLQLPDYTVPALHGVWGDGQDATYAVGGDLLAYPAPMSGVIYKR